MNYLWRLVGFKRSIAGRSFTHWLRLCGLEAGQGTMIDPTVYVDHPEKIQMGSLCEVRRGACLIARTDREVGIRFGPGVHIHQFAYMDSYGGHISLGEGVRIGHFSVIAGHGGVVFGDYSGVAGHSYIIAANHSFADQTKPHVLQEETKEGIRIGANVWGGNSVIILDGVTIGDNCVIGAGAVVRKDVPNNSVVLGNPAKVVYRFPG